MEMKMSNQKVSVNLGGSFTTLLAVLFIGLKLTGHIAWSWWWVLSPIWIPFAIVLSIAACVFGVYIGAHILDTIGRWRRRRRLRRRK
jgi:hypothetical protein